MITVFTTAKPFVGENQARQINAMRSWKRLDPDIEILLFGEGAGYSEAVRDLGLVWIEHVATSSHGVPLIGSMFELAQQRGSYPIQMYVNCDIILLADVRELLRILDMPRFLGVGQRWDIGLSGEIDFAQPNWRALLLQKVVDAAVLHPPLGSDYFIYRGDVWTGLPPLVVGRAGYDNYLIYHCRATNVPVVDSTGAITAIHQNHDYSHHPAGLEGVCNGPEAELNQQRIDKSYYFTPVDADWRIVEGKLTPNHARGSVYRYVQSLECISRNKRDSPLRLAGLSLFLWIHHVGGYVRRALFVRRAKTC